MVKKLTNLTRAVVRFRLLILALVVATVVLLVGLAGGPGPVLAQDTPDAASEGPLEVRAGVYILSIGNLSTATGTYVVDMYLTLECDEACTPNKFEFMNGRATSTTLLEDEPNYKSYRIQAALQTNPDLRKYPFDKHHLFIEFEDQSNSTTRLVYVADDALNGVDPSVIIAGWQLESSEARVVDHLYPTFDATYSRFQFDVLIARGTLSSILKAIVPALAIVASGFLALLLGPDKALQRLGINTSALIGGIMFHINLTSQLPPLGYLTLADKFMIVNYVGLIGALAATVVLVALTTTGAPAGEKSATAARLHKATAITIPVVWLVCIVALFVTA